MKTIAIIAAAGLALVSAAAFAQMQHHGHGAGSPAQSKEPGGMQQKMMQQKMQGPHHGNMQHGGTQHGGQGGGHGGGHAGHAADKPKGDTGPASQAFRAINEKMHRGMDIAFTGDADVDFVRGMIPHHEGAVDMAKTVLAFGKDPEIRKLAEEIVRAQETEIAQMKGWLERNKR
jgi:hypothetical protein